MFTRNFNRLYWSIVCLCVMLILAACPAPASAPAAAEPAPPADTDTPVPPTNTPTPYPVFVLSEDIFANQAVIDGLLGNSQGAIPANFSKEGVVAIDSNLWESFKTTIPDGGTPINVDDIWEINQPQMSDSHFIELLGPLARGESAVSCMSFNNVSYIAIDFPALGAALGAYDMGNMSGLSDLFDDAGACGYVATCVGTMGGTGCPIPSNTGANVMPTVWYKPSPTKSPTP